MDSKVLIDAGTLAVVLNLAGGKLFDSRGSLDRADIDAVLRCCVLLGVEAPEWLASYM